MRLCFLMGNDIEKVFVNQIGLNIRSVKLLNWDRIFQLVANVYLYFTPIN